MSDARARRDATPLDGLTAPVPRPATGRQKDGRGASSPASLGCPARGQGGKEECKASNKLATCFQHPSNMLAPIVVLRGCSRAATAFLRPLRLGGGGTPPKPACETPTPHLHYKPESLPADFALPGAFRRRINTVVLC